MSALSPREERAIIDEETESCDELSNDQLIQTYLNAVAGLEHFQSQMPDRNVTLDEAGALRFIVIVDQLRERGLWQQVH